MAVDDAGREEGEGVLTCRRKKGGSAGWRVPREGECVPADREEHGTKNEEEWAPGLEEERRRRKRSE